jgi:nitrate reductase cytochrome c-type subunit
MQQYQWTVTAEKCNNAWKVGIQDETGAVYFSKKTFVQKDDAQKLADYIFKEEMFPVSDFVYDSK